MRGAAWSALFSHWRRQPLQLLVLVIGLSLATGLWSAVQAINAQARASYDRATAQSMLAFRETLRAPSGVIALQTYIALRRAGWQISPVLEGRYRLGDTWVTLRGVDLTSYPLLPADRDSTTESTDLYAAMIAPGQLFTDPQTAALAGETPGLPPIVGSTDITAGTALTDMAVAARLLQAPDRLSYLMVLRDQPMGLPPIAEIAPDLIAEPADPGADAARLTDSFHLNLTAFGLLSFAVGLFIVHGTVGLAFQQRRAMFRTLRALGLPLRTLVTLVMGELLVIALLSGVLGLILGYGIAAALLPNVAATLRGLYGASVDGGLVLRPAWAAAGLMMALAGTAIAGAQGVWRLYRLPLLAAPGVQAWSAAQGHGAQIAAGFGVALALAGVALHVALPGLIGGFALLGGLLLGAALALPLLLATVLTLLARLLRGPVADWVWSDLRAQLPGLSLALMALLLALATNIGVGTMVSSFRTTFTGWLDQRLASELYVTARTTAQGDEIEQWLRPRARAILPIRSVPAQLNGRPGAIYGVVDDPTYRDNWPLISAQANVWDVVAQGQGALINEQLARRANLWPGDSVTLMPDWALPVAGVYSDYGNPEPQAMVALPALLARAPEIENRRFGIRIAPDQAATLAEDLRREFQLSSIDLVDQAQLKARSVAVFENTFVVTGALNVLTLGVAGFAILTSLLTLWTQRLPQVAPVWALGLSRARLARLDLLRSMVLAGVTGLLALPLGLMLAWILLNRINTAAFGWQLPMFLFPADWIRLWLLALAAGALAGALPARHLRRVPPAELLKVFANER
jgi:putative ABC transport system permease protein